MTIVDSFRCPAAITKEGGAVRPQVISVVRGAEQLDPVITRPTITSNDEREGLTGGGDFFRDADGRCTLRSLSDRRDFSSPEGEDSYTKVSPDNALASSNPGPLGQDLTDC